MSLFDLVLSEEGERPVIEDNNILLWNNAVNACEYVPLTPELRRQFNLSQTDVEISSQLEENIPAYVDEQTYVPSTQEQGKFTWTHQSTLLLLDEYKSRIVRFRDPKIKKKTLWEEIAQEMMERNYLVEADSLDRKMRNMKNTYRTICDNNNKKKSTGRGRIQWEYYTYFVDIFQADKTVNLPKSILSSTLIRPSTSSSELFVDTSCGNSSSSSMGTMLSTKSRPSVLSPATVEELSMAKDTPTSSGKAAHANRLEKFRKRQLELEEEKLVELKKIREGIEESNKLQKEKLDLLKEFMSKSN